MTGSDTYTQPSQQKPAAPPERRRRVERRQRDPVRDARGYIVTPTYVGPDRRTGLDRRAYLERQRRRIMAEKMRFIQRSSLTFAVMFFLIVTAGVFLLAPEYAWLQRRAERMATLPARAEQQVEDLPLGLAVNRKIATAEKVVDTLSPTFQDMVARAGAASDLAAATARQLMTGDAADLRDLVAFVGNTHAMAASAQGQAQLDGAINRLKDALGGWHGDASSFSAAVQAARGSDPVLDSMLSSVSTSDVEAAAMLLLLGEFRDTLSAGRPFEQDLAVISRLTAGDPALQKSLARLAPYAQSGVLTRATLQNEVQALAGEVALAGARGEPLNIEQRAGARLQALAQPDAQRDAAHAAVVQAQEALSVGDVAGAVVLLQSLQGEDARAAAPVIARAQGLLLAEQSSSLVVNAVLGQLAAGGGVNPEGLKSLVGGSLDFGGPVSVVSPR